MPNKKIYVLDITLALPYFKLVQFLYNDFLACLSCSPFGPFRLLYLLNYGQQSIDR